MALLAMYMVAKNEKTAGFKQSDLYFALTSLAAAASSGDVQAFGYAMWASGYLSLSATRNTNKGNGGVFEALMAAIKKSTDYNLYCKSFLGDVVLFVAFFREHSIVSSKFRIFSCIFEIQTCLLK